MPTPALLEYHGLQLQSRYSEEGPRLYTVHAADGTLLEILNLDAFRTASELEALLDEIVAFAPRDREAWRRRAIAPE